MFLNFKLTMGPSKLEELIGYKIDYFLLTLKKDTQTDYLKECLSYARKNEPEKLEEFIKNAVEAYSLKIAEIYNMKKEDVITAFNLEINEEHSNNILNLMLYASPSIFHEEQPGIEQVLEMMFKKEEKVKFEV